MNGFKPGDCIEDSEFALAPDIGLSKYLCPECGAHLKEVKRDHLICLNACHLGVEGKKAFKRFIERNLNDWRR